MTHPPFELSNSSFWLLHNSPKLLPGWHQADLNADLAIGLNYFIVGRVAWDFPLGFY
jgi:hypothetical protein